MYESSLKSSVHVLSFRQLDGGDDDDDDVSKRLGTDDILVQFFSLSVFRAENNDYLRADPQQLCVPNWALQAH